MLGGEDFYLKTKFLGCSILLEVCWDTTCSKAYNTIAAGASVCVVLLLLGKSNKKYKLFIENKYRYQFYVI